jgi:ABC-type sugar transport system ATPase subunit
LTASLTVNGLTKRYGDVSAVDQLDLELYPGQIFGLLGPNAAGKTTTIRMLAGIIRPTSGSASVLGMDLISEIDAIKSRIGYVAQQFALYPELTVSENLAFYSMEATIRRGRLLREILTSLQDRHGVVTVFCVYHGSEDGIVMRKLLPPFQHLLHKPQQFSHPPLLHQSPREFLVELVEHYLFAALNQMLYTSLMMENHQRVSHLEGAVKHLDDESAELAQQCNVLRQEEIIEEIEVILLSAASLDEDQHGLK